MERQGTAAPGEAELGRPVIHVPPMGNLANQMLQYMAALRLRKRVPEAVISGVHLPIFGIHHPLLPAAHLPAEIVTEPRVDADRLAGALVDGRIARVELRSYAQRMENFLPVSAYRALFVADAQPAERAGDEDLLINIRQGDILDGHHPDYVLVPIDFYASLIEETGLEPIFMGQLEDSPYMAALRARFPRARYWPSGGPALDFERIRTARNIVPSVSTFAWVAAWLAADDARIFLPVLGLLNPAQNRGVDLLPLADARYRFYHFPIHYSSDVSGFAAAHASLRGLWRFLPPDRLERLLTRTPPPRQKHLYLGAFDESFYREVYPDIRDAIAAGHLPNGRTHYDRVGYDEGRSGFALDRAWYCRNYPIAALEIAQNEFTDADQHWLEMGQARGYRRGPM